MLRPSFFFAACVVTDPSFYAAGYIFRLLNHVLCSGEILYCVILIYLKLYENTLPYYSPLYMITLSELFFFFWLKLRSSQLFASRLKRQTKSNLFLLLLLYSVFPNIKRYANRTINTSVSTSDNIFAAKLSRNSHQLMVA